MEDISSSMRYLEQGEVARGGMGVIIKVRDRTLDRPLAMKRMLSAPDPAGGEAEVDRFARFMEEAHVTAQLDHPGIVPVHDLGEDADGCAYYTMKLVRGRELGEVISLARSGGSNWNLPRLLGVLVRVCQAVAYAHGKGVVHRDLKPANIMVGDLGEVYVMDWGLAKQLDREDVHDIRLKLGDELAGTGADTIISPRSGSSQSSIDAPLMTMDGAVVGTPAYMPPEQAAGIVDQVDHLSHIYALGAILYEMLSQGPPYQDSGHSAAEVLSALSNGPPTPVRRIRPDAPLELIAICDKAMSRSREQRYESCLELANDLEAFLNGHVVQAYQTGALAEFKKFILRHKASSVAALIAVLTLSALVVLQTISNRKLSTSLANEAAASEAAQNSLAESYAATALRHAGEGNTDDAVQWFAMAANTTRDPEIRDDHLVRVRSWSRHSFELLRAIRAAEPSTGRVVFHPSGRYLKASDSDGNAIWDLATEQRIELQPGVTVVFQAAWNPAGDLLAIATRQRTVSVLSWPGLEEQFTVTVPDRKIYFALAFDASGTRLAMAGGAGLEVWSVPEQKRLCHYRRPKERVHSLAFDATGDHLVAATNSPKEERAMIVLPVRDLDGGAVEPLHTPIRHHWLPRVVLSPDRTMFRVRSPDGQNTWHAVATAQPAADPFHGGDPVAIRTDGALMVTTDGSNAVLRKTGDPQARAVVPMGGLTTHAEFLPKRGMVLLASRNGTVRLVRTRDGTVVGNLMDQGHPVNGLAVSPDGRLAAVATAGGLIRIHRLERDADRDRVVIRSMMSHISRVALHPGGKLFAATGRGHPIREFQVHRLDDGQPAGPVVTFDDGLFDLLFSPDGETVVALTALEKPGGSAPHGGTLDVRDWKDGQRLGDPIAMPSRPGAAIFHPDDPQQVIVWCFAGQVVSCDLSKRTVRPLFTTTAWPPRLGDANGSPEFRLSPDRMTLALFGTEKGQVYFWNLADHTVRVQNLQSDSPCHDLDFHPTAPVVAASVGTASEANPTRFLHYHDGTEIAPPITAGSWPYVGRFDHSGELLLRGGNDNQLAIFAWRDSSSPLQTIKLDGPLVAAATVPERPNWVVTSAANQERGTVRIWDARSGTPLTPPLPGNDISSPYVLQSASEGRRLLVSGAETEILMWRLDHLFDPGLPLPALQRLAELRSGASALDDGTSRQLGVEEWFARWKEFRTDFPELLPFQP